MNYKWPGKARTKLENMKPELTICCYMHSTAYVFNNRIE